MPAGLWSILATLKLFFALPPNYLRFTASRHRHWPPASPCKHAQEIGRAATAGATLLTLDEPASPPLMGQIYNPPVALYVRGDPAVLSRPGIAVVGTRHPSPYGMGMAERLAGDLANAGLAIFSGLSAGVLVV